AWITAAPRLFLRIRANGLRGSSTGSGGEAGRRARSSDRRRTEIGQSISQTETMRLIILLQHPGAGPLAPPARQFGEKTGGAGGAVVLGIDGAGPGRYPPAAPGRAEPVQPARQDQADGLALFRREVEAAGLGQGRALDGAE